MKPSRTLGRLLLAVLLLAGLGAFSAFGQSATGTTTLSVSVGPEASLVIDTATTNLTTTGTVFADYTGTTNFTYKVRTTQGSGTASITVLLTEFAGSGGPTVANLTYLSTPISPATGVTSTAASKASATTVASFTADMHSATSGTSGNTVSWTLANDPAYKTGTYSATATFSISAT
jgi:hypothetical protein